MADRDPSITHDEQLDRFVEAQVASGAYASADDVIRAGVRLLAERQARIDALDAAIQAGLDSGPARPFDFDHFIAQMRARADRRA